MKLILYKHNLKPSSQSKASPFIRWSDFPDYIQEMIKNAKTVEYRDGLFTYQTIKPFKESTEELAKWIVDYAKANRFRTVNINIDKYGISEISVKR
jgi:hypothetical protein